MNATRPTCRCVLFASLFVPAVVLCLVVGCSMFGGSPPAKPRVKTAGTTSDDEIMSRLRSGDQLSIRMDTGQPKDQAPPSEVIIDEDGDISLPLVGRIKAGGLTASELAERIQANYVPRYYVRCNATVLVAQRFFYVGGEVRNPNRFLWSDDTTLLKAVNTAGGFTDYANRRKVQLIRGKETQAFNCEELQRNPTKDVAIRPGDSITVPRSIF
jgi:protein involved in polysaccharide export with SLBB domain